MKFDIGRIIGIALIVFLLMTTWFLFESNETTKRNNVLLTQSKKDIEKRLSDLAQQKKELETAVLSLKKENDALSAKASEYDSKLQSVSQDMEKVKADAQEELAKKTSELEALQKKIEEYENEVIELNRKLSQMYSVANKKRPKDAKQVMLEPITVTSKGKNENAKVMEVNKEYGFIIINMGSDDGIKEGDSLFVFRHKNMLGRVVVEKVGDNVSVAKILSRGVGDSVEKGDLISY